MPGRTFSKWAFPFVGLVSAHLLAAAVPAPAQETASPESSYQPRRVTSFEHANQEVTLKCDVGMLIVKAYADNIIHLRYDPGPYKKRCRCGGFWRRHRRPNTGSTPP